MEADNKSEGRSVSAITRRIGAENRRSEINIEIKKKIVLTHLKTLVLLSSFKKPISIFLH